MLTLVLGGARSGKSRYAQSLCASSSRVIYIATAHAGAGADDHEMRERIARHRADRPAEWQTVEEPLVLSRAVLEAPVEATLLIDCITLWISNLMWEFREKADAEQEKLILAEVDNLIDAVRLRSEKSIATGSTGEVVIVSNEVGGGLAPEHPVARAFRDLQGFANQRLAQAADTVVFIIAGLPLRLKPGAAVTSAFIESIGGVIMKSIATQHGDGGQTRLIGGAQVSKSDLRVKAYGAIDELGAGLGFARSISGDEEINQLTKEIQRELFLVAGSLANPRALQKQPPDVTPEMAERLTREVHRLESLEGILTDWALPGDHAPAAAYDLARSVCRRAERCVVRLRETGEEVSDEVIRYLNRLSDLLWLFGRTLELRAGVDSRLRDEAHGGNPFSRAW